MTIELEDGGRLRLRQILKRPVVYLDHWAVRLFSEDGGLQQRFVSALHRSKGTLLFSTANIFEFTAMTDLSQAVATEEFLHRVMPALHVADTTLDKGYLLEEGAPVLDDSPPQHWLLRDLGERARIAGGSLNTRRFVQDAIAHSDMLKPLFDNMKAGVASSVSASLSPQATAVARKFVPVAGMTLRSVVMHELMREPHVNPAYTFDENDAMDFIHTAPAALVADLILLDSRWCHKLECATKRIRRGGIKGRIARPFSKRSVSEFLCALENTPQDWRGVTAE